MKIRRKLPKLTRSGHPLYVIGYSSTPPSPAELQTWFDLEYGGPIRFTRDTKERKSADDPSSLVFAVHGPWAAAFRASLPPAEAAAWKDLLGWRHPLAGHVVRGTATPNQTIDSVLFVARLARGLALLTDGTAYDTTTRSYLNPSDWKDRPLGRFIAGDHITVEQAESAEAGQERIYTRGLAKFGLDELETLRPIGLPTQQTAERLVEIADEILRIGQCPAVGTTTPLPRLGLTLTVTGYRTVPQAEVLVKIRKIDWQNLGGETSA
jgi:hypothetical protein